VPKNWQPNARGGTPAKLNTSARREEAPSRAVIQAAAPIPAVLRNQRFPKWNSFTGPKHVALSRDCDALLRNQKAVVLAAAWATIPGGRVLAVIDPVVMSERCMQS
jgi:hypothetical protein